MLIWFTDKGGAYAEVEDIVPCLVCRWGVKPLLVPECEAATEVETAGARRGGVGPLGELAGAGGTLSWRMEEMEAVS